MAIDYINSLGLGSRLFDQKKQKNIITFLPFNIVCCKLTYGRDLTECCWTAAQTGIELISLTLPLIPNLLILLCVMCLTKLATWQGTPLWVHNKVTVIFSSYTARFSITNFIYVVIIIKFITVYILCCLSSGSTTEIDPSDFWLRHVIYICYSTQRQANASLINIW